MIAANSRQDKDMQMARIERREVPARLITRSKLPLREREVADVVFSRGEVTANEVCGILPPLSNSSVRVMLQRLERKGVVRKRREGKRNFYSPAISEEPLRETILKRVADDHFDGSLFATALKIIEMMEIQQPGSAGRIVSRYRPLPIG